MIFAFSYPFMKRFTYWPQLYLGFTFNWGIIMAWAAIVNDISYLPILLYVGAIFWTLGYDTIYGVQDISDDEVIGVKSTAIKFKKNINIFVMSCYLISVAAIIFVMISLKVTYSSIFLGFFIISLLYQLKIFKINNSSSCLKAFKINNVSGLMVFLSLFLINIDF